MIMRQERDREIMRRRHRKAKLLKLRTQLAAADSGSERERIIQKIRRISPGAPLPSDK
jgi:hypothetical protein